MLYLRIKTAVKEFRQDKKGEMVGSIGWMALIATILVVVHGLLTGWLPGFIDRIFSAMNRLV